MLDTESSTLTEVTVPDAELDEDKKEKLGELAGILKSKVASVGFQDVILTKTPQTEKIIAIKVIREIIGLGLAAAKELVENPPAPIVQGVSMELAAKIQAESEIVSRMQGRWQSKA
ncbi:hypothetical protein Hs30E_10540 [Lactococcus hodotermopsidis]|uniref:Large ribosomal subunit protein bL12 C-terminal domain-containing protein n=1 Tax=Pseudolactococcus hodotermopsidis TaxID=2709157 RepID=A0A6A0BCS3_9LACT|nr:ribosomal protein L7/L12 [Lactococcus hodotermopsidis]GFH42503.1 hypothetical protein Hs30E_10540 [Lactococcus hodotermopsidis]